MMAWVFLVCGHTMIADNAVFNIKDYGALGDGKSDNAAAIQKAIDACFAAGGGRVLVPGPSAVYLSGPLEL
ncbi:MAG: glycoside hydrolase family 28 protein, partial [Bacteroidetes bacterium]|nr:glycoside hydrolase family 28 protein [Bacteroidota bacterium]